MTKTTIQEREESIRSRFAIELVRNIARGQQYDPQQDIGLSILLGDIIGNPLDTTGITSFTGIYLFVPPQGRISFKAMKTKADNEGKVITASYPIAEFGLRKAFEKAVEKRAELCGFMGKIPFEKLSIPSANSILEQLTNDYGEAWTERRNVRQQLSISVPAKAK